jgi:hypothetical protein
MCVRNALENYSSIKENEIRSFVGTWMELEIILSEILWVQTERQCLLPYIEP